MIDDKVYDMANDTLIGLNVVAIQSLCAAKVRITTFVLDSSLET